MKVAIEEVLTLIEIVATEVKSKLMYLQFQSELVLLVQSFYSVK